MKQKQREFLKFREKKQVILYIYIYEKVAQSYQTLCDPMDYIVHGILQARILE